MITTASKLMLKGRKQNKKIALIVNSGKAYYLQVVENDKFTTVGQYTWKVNLTNDDNIDFTFKFR